jgi:DNA-directed RNA polymerase specialized sigma24 family protein
MEKSEIRKILKNPSKDLVNIALSYVNLTEKEKEILEYVEMKGITEERTAEILDMSTRNLQTIKASAFEKLSQVWSYNLFISMLLKRV